MSILEALARADVDFVLIGGIAGGAHGSSYGTFDVDVAYDPEPSNLALVARVLEDLDATLEEPLEGHVTVLTRYGSLDLRAFGPSEYRRLRGDATVIQVLDVAVAVASLDHLIAMGERAGRPKDKLRATEYRMLSDELRAPREPEVG